MGKNRILKKRKKESEGKERENGERENRGNVGRGGIGLEDEERKKRMGIQVRCFRCCEEDWVKPKHVGREKNCGQAKVWLRLKVKVRCT